LSALEKIPGVGSLRSLGSMSSITLDRVKRDDSSHNLGSINFDRVKREDSSHSLGPSPATSVSFFFFTKQYLKSLKMMNQNTLKLLGALMDSNGHFWELSKKKQIVRDQILCGTRDGVAVGQTPSFKKF
jgi:hypothetical protein